MVLSPDKSSLRHSQVRLDRNEYDRLLLVASKYDKLCQNLIRGGVDTDTLEILSKNNGSQGSETDLFEGCDSFEETQTDSSPESTVVNYRGRSFPTGGPFYTVRKPTNITPDSEAESDSFSESVVSNDENSLVPDDSASVVAPRHPYQQNAKRTLQLGNLPPNTSRKDVVAVIRGGPVVDIYFHFKEHRAAVSFIHGDHAQKYYEFAQSTGVYIRGSLIHVSWNSRHFILAPYISQQLRGGASRNLVVRHYDRRITAESIREDLEHIHNLAVIDVEFSGLDCFLKTNSITAASFARTFMMSRLVSRIEWAPDECMQSLGQLKSKTPHMPVVQTNVNWNRFSPLDTGGQTNI
ncbi:hypothetical protein PWT90_00068 [Aphanocladium album]|nr:hypothetical protein PWT90_00068 [Aphanocladium album]